VGINVARIVGPRTHVAPSRIPFTHTRVISPGVARTRVIIPGTIVARIRSPNIVTPGIRPCIVAAVAVLVHIRVQSIGFVLVLFGIRPVVLRGRLPLLCLLAKPRRLDLCLLGVGLGMHGPGFVFARLKAGVLRVSADLGSVLAVLLIPLLPERLPGAYGWTSEAPR
jgi:hypothetical protein